MFHAKLEAAVMTQSMSKVAKYIDNGPVEGFWGNSEEITFLRKALYGQDISGKED